MRGSFGSFTGSCRGGLRFGAARPRMYLPDAPVPRVMTCPIDGRGKTRRAVFVCLESDDRKNRPLSTRNH